MRFLSWLVENTSPQFRTLKSYILDRAPRWHDVDDLNTGVDLLRADEGIAPEVRTQLENLLSEAWKRSAEASSAAIPKNTREKDHLVKILLGYIPGAVLVIIVLVTIMMIGLVLWPAPQYTPAGDRVGLLLDLSDLHVARGLITFFFAFGVIMIALSLIVALFVIEGERSAEKFDKAKEIFTSLIAIFGTILGFYFGVAQDDEPTPVTPTTQAESGHRAG